MPIKAASTCTYRRGKSRNLYRINAVFHQAQHRGSQPVCAAARQRLEEESDSSSRLGSIRLLHALWEEFAAAAAPEGEQDAQQQGGWRKALAALGGSVMNAAVGACMYDAVGKVRLAATRLLLAVAPHLPPEEVLKVALVKARER